MKFTSEQIIALAPDDSSVKAGRGLVNPAKWPTLGQSEEAMWGECQGSGSKPYQVSIDLSGPAFKCTCPSRKFPCKHGLGLLFISAEKPAAIKGGAPPAWVADWLISRREKSEKKAAAATEKKEAPVDPEAAAKKAAKRLLRMKEGGEELARWLADQVKSGIATYPQQPPSYFTGVGSRMVDAQIPGLSGEMSRLEALVHSGEGWPRRVLAQLGRMHLLTEALGRYELLPPALQGDLRSYLGWPIEKEEVIATQTSVDDEWFVVGQTFVERDKLWERRTWLLGFETRRAALLLEFAHGNRTFAVPLPVGYSFKGKVVFYPAAFPLRALLLDAPADSQPIEQCFPAVDDFDAVINLQMDRLARNPWLLSAPVAASNVTPIRRNEHWFLRDNRGAELSLRMAEMDAWELLACSGGQPITVFGEWNGSDLRVLSFWSDSFQIFLTPA